MSEARTRLWAMLNKVESHTAARYAAVAPDLVTASKREALDAIHGTANGGGLAGSRLENAVDALLDAAVGDGSRGDALLLQGVVLEHLGVTLYRCVGESGHLPADEARVAALAGEASGEVAAKALAEACSWYADPSDRFAAFTGRTDQLFVHLDALGEALDAELAGPFGIGFADVMGEFVADLLPACTDGLGFERRKVIAHLTSALMA